MPQGPDIPPYLMRVASSPRLLALGLVLGIAAGGVSFVFWPKQYVSTARVLFGGGTSLSLPAGLSLGGGGGSATIPQMNSVLGFGQGKAPSSDIVQAIFSSEGASSDVMDKFHLQSVLDLPKSRDLALRAVSKKHLTIKKVRSVIVEVSFRAPSAKLAQDCVTEYLRYCDAYTSKNAVTASRRTRIYIDAKVKENAEQIHELERRLGAFLDTKGLQLMQAQPEVGGKLLADVAKANYESQAKAEAWRTKLDSLTARSAQALQDAQRDLNSPIASSDPLVGQIQSNLAKAEVELDQLQETMTAEHPKVKEAQAKVQTLTGQLETRLRSASSAASNNDASELLTIAAEADSAAALRDRQAKQFADTVKDVRQGAGLVVQQQILKAQLESLLRKRELLSIEQTRARIAEEQESLKLEILDPPSLPDRHDWPRRSLWLLGGGAIGVALMAVWNFVRSNPRK